MGRHDERLKPDTPFTAPAGSDVAAYGGRRGRLRVPEREATAGNLSVQIDKLEKAGYIGVRKEFAGRRPHTVCFITPKGHRAFTEYVEALKTYLPLGS